MGINSSLCNHDRLTSLGRNCPQAQERIAFSRELAAAAISNLDVDPQLSLLLSQEAILVTYSVDQHWTTEAEVALRRALEASHIELTLRGHTKSVESIAFSPDGKLLATASCDWTAKVWDILTGTELLTLSGHTDTVIGVAFSPGCVNFSQGPAGQFEEQIATTSRDGSVKVWNVFFNQEMEDLLAVARTRVTRSLTTEECQKYLHVEHCPTEP